jgi:hypothetical protein
VARKDLIAGPPVEFVIGWAARSIMLAALLVLLRTIGLICGHRAVALENVAAPSAGGRPEACEQASTTSHQGPSLWVVLATFLVHPVHGELIDLDHFVDFARRVANS